MELKNIKPNPNNPRVIKDEKYKKLLNSLKDFPKMLESRPIVCVTDTDGKLYPLGGNMRYRALKELGYKEIPDNWVKIVDDYTEDERKEFTIKDNVAFGEWDFEALANDWELHELEEWGLDLPQLELEEVLEATEDDFDVTPPEIAKTVLGDLYEIGEHRLLCGDSTCSDTVAKLMNGHKADMVFTDPPYGMNAVSKSGVLKDRYKTDILGDSDINAAKNAFNLIYSLFQDAIHIWWGANYYSNCLPNSECWLVWDKNNGQSDQTDCELAWTNARSVVRQFTKASEKINRVHPTQKPIDLISWAVKKFANNANLICDYFLGSGATMAASHQLKRKCYGMELDPKYCDVIVKRMLKLDPNLTVKRNGEIYLPD